MITGDPDLCATVSARVRRVSVRGGAWVESGAAENETNVDRTEKAMDKIFEAFLERQYREALDISAASDIVGLIPLGGPPPTHYVARFHCRGLVKDSSGGIEEAGYFEAGICFPPDYLRRADPYVVVTWFGPPNVWHPNISDRGPVICVGRIAPGTSLRDLVHQVYEVITYQKYTPNEFDSLNKAACAWARSHAERFPVDRRPLRRRTLDLEVTPP